MAGSDFQPENIKMVDLQGQYQKIRDEIDRAMDKVLNDARFINGPEVNEFAGKFAEYNQVKHVIPCGNGTDALQVALMAMEWERGDEVIVPSFTYVATTEVVGLLGLEPVFVEVDPDHFNMDPAQVEEAVTSRTRGIIPVHLYGQCADMEPILHIAEKHDLFVIEDAAQATGVEYTFSSGNKARAGTMGTVGATSFFPTKNLGCYGDGGALMTEDDRLAERIRCIANHGQTKKYHHETLGINSRLDTMQAAVLLVKLRHLDEFAATRQGIAGLYDSLLKDVKEVRIPGRSANSTHVFHQYTLKIEEGKRDDLQGYLKGKNVPSVVYYPVPQHLQKANAQFGYKKGDLPLTERLCNEVLSLPMHTELSDEQVQYIADSIKEFFSEAESS